MRSILFFVVFLLGIVNLSAQGPWAPGKGKGYSQLLFNNVPNYSSVYNGGGTIRQSERILGERILAAFLEVGVTNRISLGANVPFIMTSSGDPSDENVLPVFPDGELSNLGNIGLFGKYTIIDKALKVALIGQVDLATSDRDDVTGLSTGVDANTYQPKISVGGGINNFFGYGFFGYGIRSNDFNDFLYFGVEGGLKLGENLSILLNIHRWDNIDNGDPSVDSPANIETGLYTSFQEFNGFHFKILAENIYKGFGGFVSLGGGSGNSVPASPALSLGAFYKW